MAGAVRAELVPGVNDGFSITVGIKLVTELFELGAQLAIVVNLAVENNPRGAILIVNRLVAALEIDDRQATHCQTDALTKIEAVIVRPTVTNCAVHAGEKVAINRRAIAAHNSGYPAHGVATTPLPGKSE